VSNELSTREQILRATFGEQPWYAVRCVFQLVFSTGQRGYEERITLWRADSFDAALAQAEQEGHRYVEDNDHIEEFTGLGQAYHLFADPDSGAEVFSLIRRSELDTDAYVAHFFDTGQENTRHT
jgi:hypothetical protein